MNPILQQLNAQSQTPPQVGQVKSLMNMIQCSANPLEAMQSFLASNPTFKEIYPLIKQNNGDYKKTFFDLAAQRGIDPNEVLKFLK